MKIEFWRIRDRLPLQQYDNEQDLTADGDYHECFLRIELMGFVKYVCIADIAAPENYIG